MANFIMKEQAILVINKIKLFLFLTLFFLSNIAVTEMLANNS